MDKIVLNGMKFFGYHGVYAEENRLGQQFYADVELEMDLSRAGHTDDLEDTINYAEIYERIKQIVQGKPFKLIEALTEAIASDLLHQYTRINEVTVRLTKPHPPFDVHFDGVTVHITRRRA